MSIGNLTLSARRSRKENAAVLIALLPNVPKNPQVNETRRSWHMAMRQILQPLEAVEKQGLMINCADGYIRRCYPRLARWLADYPEQVLLCDVKYGRCPICECPAEDMARLTGSTYRSRDYARYQNLYQRLIDSLTMSGMTTERAAKHAGKAMLDNYSIWIIDVENFGANHMGNVYSLLGPDYLHQLLNGMLGHGLEWARDYLAESLNMSQEAVKGAVDKRFSEVPPFPNLKYFGQKMSQIQQWTGAEYKSMLRVWMPVMAPLFRNSPGHLRGMKSLTDFIMIASYPTHSEETLKYLQRALKGFEDSLPLWPRESFDKIVKLHAMRHYVDLIREYGAIDHTDTEMTEALHSDIKRSYEHSNKVAYEPQMLAWNDRLFLIHDRTSLYQYLVSTDSHHTEVCRTLVLPRSPPVKLGPTTISAMSERRLTLSELGQRISVADLPQRVGTALERVSLWEKLPPDLQLLCSSTPYMKNLRVIPGSGVRITFEDVHIPSKVHVERARCTMQWQNRGQRYDHVLVYNRSRTGSQVSYFKQNCLDVGKLISVFRYETNLGNIGEGKGRMMIDFAVIGRLDVQGSKPNANHGMYTVKGPQRLLVVPVSNIRRAVHLVPTDRQEEYFLNAYVDLNMYNLVY
jgi:hypothetical protein